MEKIEITIKYLVNFIDKTGKKLEKVAFEKGADLTAVSEWLLNTYKIQVPGEDVMCLLNGHSWNQYTEGANRELENGDVILIMPLIMGG
jgi:molybdopterin converting factor small subunit